MKKLKLYEANDKMIDLIDDNYAMLQELSAFGIRLGFGDKTVCQVCEEQGVDTHTFLTVVNFLINGFVPKQGDENISVNTLLAYLRASHKYLLDFQLPCVSTKLEDALDCGDRLGGLILRLYDRYSHDIRQHMKYEEKTLFPYVEALLRGEETSDYTVDIFAKHHNDIACKLQELKNIIIKYLPHDHQTNNQLTSTLYDIYSNEQWLTGHSNVEEQIFVPAIRLQEQRIKTDRVNARINSMIKNAESGDSVSEREKEIIVCLIQGMSNKEIAAKLFISVHTVITHRRNIARKLQIHSLAGLTIYAIANGLIDKSAFIS